MKVKLNETGKIITGNTPKTSEIENYSSNDIPFIKPSDILEDDIVSIRESEFWISDHARKKARILPPNSVLVTCIGIIGKVAINTCECAFNQQINAIIPDSERYLPEYLAYAILAKQKYLQDIANAPVVPIINKSQFADIDIQTNDIQTQKRVVDKLSHVSELIKFNNYRLNKFDELVKSRFMEMFGDLETNPMNWSVVKIANISVLLKSGLSRKLSDEDIGLPVVRSGNIQNGYFYPADIKYWFKDDPQGAKTKDYIIDDGDILINFINSVSQIGKVAIFKSIGRDCIYTTNIFRMKLADNCNEYYFNWFAMSDYYFRQLQNIIQPAVNQASFTTGKFLNLNIPLPPIYLQNQFADFVAKVEQQKSTVQKSIDKLETLKKSLMQKYFG